MRRVEIAKPGGYDRLRLVEEPGPQPGPSEVLVQVDSIGVNYADCVVRMGLYESAEKYVGWPITPGFEFAGIVQQTGVEVGDFAPNERVFGVTRFGAYQSELVVDRSQLFRVPENWTLPQAASFPVAFLTAWYALCELCRVRPGNVVLVHSAAGGVGGAATQIAKSLGAAVVGVVGAPHKVESARNNGCDQVIDKSREPLWKTLRAHHPAGVHVVLDPNGQETLRKSYEHLCPMGRLVVYGFQSMLPRGRGVASWLRLLWTYLRTPRFDPLRMTNENKSVLAFNLSYLFDHAQRLNEAISDLLAMTERSAIAPLPLTTFPLERVADAHRALETGSTTGKLVLSVRREG